MAPDCAYAKPDNYVVIQDLQQADIDATTARQNLQNAITTLQNQPLKTYSLDSTDTGDGFTPIGCWITATSSPLASELSGTNGIDVNYANGDIEITIGT